MNDYRNNNNGDVESYRRFRGDRSTPRPPPTPGEIWEGEILRMQPYGAFCSFGPISGRKFDGEQRNLGQPRRFWQGLVHISQLSETRVEKVEDVVDIGDSVWVKVIEVERQDPTDFNRNQHTNDVHNAQIRYRIKLSMKDVSQDGGGVDLGREREAKEHATTQLETNLNSMIGMGVARDPMERLVLKTDSRNIAGSTSRNKVSTKTVFRGGYTLVDSDEEKPKAGSSTTVTSTSDDFNRLAPMGRGRGATLPAWMTSTEGPVGSSGDPKNSSASMETIARNNEIVHDKHQDRPNDSDCWSSTESGKKMDRKRRKKKRKRRDRVNDYRNRKRSHASESEDNKNYDDNRRHRKRQKSSRRKEKKRRR